MSSKLRRRKAKRPKLTNLTKAERRRLEKYIAQWCKKLKPLHDAIAASERITAEDLRIIVR